MNKKEVLESALDSLEDIKNGAVPPELAIEEAEALLDYIYEIEIKIKSKTDALLEKEVIKKVNDILEKCDIKRQKNFEYTFYLEDINLIQILLNLYLKKSKMIEIMAEHLTTDTYGKDWVIKYFETEVELENGTNEYDNK